MAQKDIHAYGTLAIAKAVGYADEDAILLAWADDESDYTLQVKPWNCLWSNLGLQFHFWPADKKDLICRVDSELSKRIANDVSIVAEGIKLCSGGTAKPYMLCRIGIALHGLQDTYSHQNWIGKFNDYNVLPAWSREGIHLNWLVPPYGHSPMGKTPDIATATWYDPRTGKTINNKARVEAALLATSQALGLECTPKHISMVFADVEDTKDIGDYVRRKQKLRNLAGMQHIHFSKMRADMLKRYGVQFKAAAAAQAKIVKEYLRE